MNNSTSIVCVAIDAKNPGQFFACCGLLELADRLWPGAEGCFGAGTFSVSCRGELSAILNAMVARQPEAITALGDDLPVKPIIAPLRLVLDGDGDARKVLILDNWMRIGLDKGRATVMGNSPWNFWSGQQTSAGIWTSLCAELKRQLPAIPADQLTNLFAHRVLLSGRFGFDPGAAWDALDAGFSPNAQNLSVASSPAVELLAAVGIQRFKPKMEDRQSFIYATWSLPLAPPVAACAAAGVPITPNLVHFRGQVVSRGQYAALGYSTQLAKGDPHG
jgi:CRISPR-associated protein Csx14